MYSAGLNLAFKKAQTPQTKATQFTEKLYVISLQDQNVILLFGADFSASRQLSSKVRKSERLCKKDFSGYLLGLLTRNQKAHNFVMNSRIFYSKFLLSVHDFLVIKENRIFQLLMKVTNPLLVRRSELQFSLHKTTI